MKYFTSVFLILLFGVMAAPTPSRAVERPSVTCEQLLTQAKTKITRGLKAKLKSLSPKSELTVVFYAPNPPESVLTVLTTNYLELRRYLSNSFQLDVLSEPFSMHETGHLTVRGSKQQILAALQLNEIEWAGLRARVDRPKRIITPDVVAALRYLKHAVPDGYNSKETPKETFTLEELEQRKAAVKELLAGVTGITSIGIGLDVQGKPGISVQVVDANVKTLVESLLKAEEAPLEVLITGKIHARAPEDLIDPRFSVDLNDALKNSAPDDNLKITATVQPFVSAEEVAALSGSYSEQTAQIGRLALERDPAFFTLLRTLESQGLDVNFMAQYNVLVAGGPVHTIRELLESQRIKRANVVRTMQIIPLSKADTALTVPPETYRGRYKVVQSHGGGSRTEGYINVEEITIDRLGGKHFTKISFYTASMPLIKPPFHSGLTPDLTLYRGEDGQYFSHFWDIIAGGDINTYPDDIFNDYRLPVKIEGNSYIVEYKDAAGYWGDVTTTVELKEDNGWSVTVDNWLIDISAGKPVKQIRQHWLEQK